MSEEPVSHPYRDTKVRIQLEEELPLLLTHSMAQIDHQRRAEYESTPLLPAFWRKHTERTGCSNRPNGESLIALFWYWGIIIVTFSLNRSNAIVLAILLAIAVTSISIIASSSRMKKLTLKKPLLISLLYLLFPPTAFALWVYELSLFIRKKDSHRTISDVWTPALRDCAIATEISKFNNVIETLSKRYSMVRGHLNTCESGLAAALKRISRYKVEANPLYVETMRIDQAYADIMQKQVDALQPPLAAFEKHFQLVGSLFTQYQVVTKFNQQKSSQAQSPQDEETETSVRRLLRAEYESASRTLAVAEAALQDILRTQETLSAPTPDEEEFPEDIITSIRKTA
jgi:hypothetical protein